MFIPYITRKLTDNPSVLFLNREYIPFLPTVESEPKGPVDPPLLEGVAPEGWWENRAHDIFQAAAHITEILQELSNLDSDLLTPFAGFCAFSAGTMNLYIAKFPSMNLGRSVSAASMAESNIKFLNQLKELWKMGTGWVCFLST